MNKSIFVVTVVGVIPLLMMMSVVVTSDGLADSAKEQIFGQVYSAGGKHGEKSQKIKDRSNADRSEDHRG